MQHLSKRRGVISVFLLIIFVVSYLFMGLLVDAGRYKMAQAYAEAALDSATESILSNYNQLLFDLYGLFSVDVELAEGTDLNEAIKEKYTHYLEETLGIVENDTEQYRTKLVEAIFGSEDDTSLHMGTLYDFQIAEDGIQSGSVVTLADTANVESQIIEYMKFRAPVELAGDVDGFLNKLNAVIEIKDRIAATKKKAEIVSEYKGLSAEVSALLGELATYSRKVYWYSTDVTRVTNTAAIASGKLYTNAPYELMQEVRVYDTHFRTAVAERKKELEKVKRNFDEEIKTLVTGMQSFIKSEVKAAEEAKKAEIEIYYEGVAFSQMTIPEDVNVLNDLAWEIYVSVLPREGARYKSYCSSYSEIVEAKASVKTLDQINYEFEQKCETACDELEQAIEAIQTNAATLEAEADRLYEKIKAQVDQYTAYINKLEAAKSKEGEEGGSKGKSYDTVFDPEIEQAKANAGALLSHLDMLLNTRAQLSSIADLRAASNLRFKAQFVYLWYETNDSQMGGLWTLEKELTQDEEYSATYKNATDAKPLYQTLIGSYPDSAAGNFSEMQARICMLYSINANYQEEYGVAGTTTENSKAAEQKVEKNKTIDAEGSLPDVNLDDKGTLDTKEAVEHPEWLDINYQTSKFKEDGTEVTLSAGEIDESFLEKAMNAGLEIIDKLEGLLEDGRDNLYVDAYVMSMFPNYVDHYKKTDDNTSEKLLSDPYKSYNASFAEVEYIITGKKGEAGKSGFGEASVSAVRTRLLGTRLLFNCLAIYTDTAKYQQAHAMCAWAGPFVVLASIILMAAWAVAESVIDVMVLMGEIDIDNGEVLIFKQGNDWYFSIGGLVQKIADKAVSKVMDELQGKADALVDDLQQKADAMIYEAYTSAKDTVEDITKSVQEETDKKLAEWSDTLKENIDDLTQGDGSGKVDAAATAAVQKTLTDATEQVRKVASEGVSSLTGEIQKGVDEKIDNIKEQATIQTARLSKKLKEKTKKAIDTVGDKAKEVIGEKLTSILPVDGRMEAEGNASPRMSYTDYLYFFLFTMNQKTKVERIQSVIQANMRAGGKTEFSMETAPASLWADLECSMKFLFMSDVLVPEGLKQDGRLKLKVISAQSY